MTAPVPPEGSGSTAVHIHLDPVGGVAGDMFLAAVIDARPDLAEGALAAMAAAGLPAQGRPGFSEATGHGFRGRRFALADLPPRHDPRYPAIHDALEASALDPAVKARALDIYRLLAEAEANVHGTSLDQVHFHELAAWDTLADVTGAAHVIEHLAATGWSLSPLPLGAGRVKTAHGSLPVPAPATACLLEGFEVYDDGLPGERVTPTGAAILRHLAPATRMPSAPHRLCGQGFGFGTRTLPGTPNCLRLLVLAPDAGELAAGPRQDEIAVVTFEVDDQTPEDLAIGLDNLRAADGVLDVMQAPMFGKSNRMATHVQVLCRPDAVEPVSTACFGETTTLGLRVQRVTRAVLEREQRPGAPEVKIATRPGGLRTAKAEAAGLTEVPGGHVARRAVARTAERKALSTAGDEDGDS